MLCLDNLDDRRFAEISEQARMRISEYFPQWSDLNTHDPGVTLIELFAWLTEQQRFYMDQIEEAYPFFPLLGITLRRATAAETEVMIPEGFAPRLIAANTPLYAEDVRFETAEDVSYGGTQVAVHVIQRETVKTPIILGDAHGYPGESFSADTRGQIILDFALTVSGVTWTMTDSFRASRPDDKHYTLCRETGDITFGDGIHGALAYGEVAIAQMSLTRGPEGNIAPDRLAELAGIPVSQPKAAEGGAPCETISQVLNRFEAEQTQAVTAEDIERLVLTTPGLDALHARAFDMDDVLKPGKPRVIRIAVKLSGGALTETAKHIICERLEPYRLVCREFSITEAKTAHVSIRLELRTGPHGAQFSDRFESAVRAFFKERYSGFGAVMRVSELRAFVSDVPEVLDVTHCAFRVYGSAKASEAGDVTLEPDALAELSEVSIRILAG